MLKKNWVSMSTVLIVHLFSKIGAVSLITSVGCIVEILGQLGLLDRLPEPVEGKLCGGVYCLYIKITVYCGCHNLASFPGLCPFSVA